MSSRECVQVLREHDHVVEAVAFSNKNFDAVFPEYVCVRALIIKLILPLITNVCLLNELLVCVNVCVYM